jgi:hypothetical protein
LGDFVRLITQKSRSRAAGQDARPTLFEPFIKMIERQVALLAAAFLAVADFVL